MDLEVRGMGSEYKAKFGGQLKSYKDEVSRLETDLVDIIFLYSMNIFFQEENTN